jgi:hypothetical protein
MKIYSKEEFAYVVSSISGFTDEVGGQLLSKALVGAQTPKYVNVRLGIKGSQALNLLNSAPVFQAGDCSLTPTGTTTYTQRNLVTQHETYFEQLCYKDLWDTYQSMLMKPGQTNEDVPFESVIADLKVKQIQQRVETKLWTASTSGSDAFDGFGNLIVTGATSVANSTGVTFSSSAAYGVSGNPITEVDKLINVLSDDAQSREDLLVFMSYANFRLYVQALTRANFFINYIGGTKVIGGEASYEAMHPNSNVKVIPTIGLAGSNKVVIGPAEYMAVGFDLVSDHQKLDMWYSKDFDSIRLRSNFNYGAQIAVFAGTNYFATNNLA